MFVFSDVKVPSFTLPKFTGWLRLKGTSGGHLVQPQFGALLNNFQTVEMIEIGPCFHILSCLEGATLAPKLHSNFEHFHALLSCEEVEQQRHVTVDQNVSPYRGTRASESHLG